MADTQSSGSSVPVARGADRPTARDYQRGVLRALGAALLIAGVTGLPWDVPNRVPSLIRAAMQGDSAQAMPSNDAVTCLATVLNSIPPGAVVDLVSEDPWWFQRTVEIGYPRVRFASDAATHSLSIVPAPASVPASEGGSTTWPCLDRSVVVTRRG